MATVKRRSDFLTSEEGIEIKNRLIAMMTDATFNTASSYSANAVNYPDNLMPFVDKHLNYLNAHPELDPQKYLANIRLMTRVR